MSGPELGAEPGILVRYGRAGGRPPSDDERLEVGPDGSWTARRTIGGPRAGRFAGTLAPDVLAALAGEVEAVAGTGEAFVPTPRHGATEAVDVQGAAATLGSNEDPPEPWSALLARLRDLVADEVVRSPVAALALDATVASARIEQLGPEPVRLEPGTLEVRVVRVGPDGTPLGEWQAPAGTVAAPPDARAGIVVAGPGWTMDLPFAHDLAPEPGDVLQVRVLLRIRDEGARTVRLYLPVRA